MLSGYPRQKNNLPRHLVTRTIPNFVLTVMKMFVSRHIENNLSILFAALVAAMSLNLNAATPDNNQVVSCQDAEVIVLVGDIDNLGFGWPQGFDIFSGNLTPVHSYPYQPEPDDAPGTDRIMLGTSYDGNPPAGQDGYTNTTSRPGNLPQSIELNYGLSTTQVTSAILQIFVDDFQAPLWQSRFQAHLNGQRAAFLEHSLNALLQTGPVGRLVSLHIPPEFLQLVASGKLSIHIDDPTTGAGDGFAIDFVRLLINPCLAEYLGSISGSLIDATTGSPVEGVKVSTAGVVTVTGADGSYFLSGVPAGLAVVSTSKSGYQNQQLYVDLVADSSATLDFQLKPDIPYDILLWHIHSGGIRMGWARMGIHLGDTRANITEHLEGITDGAEISGFPFENYQTPINNMVSMINTGATMPEVAVVFDAWEPTFRSQLIGMMCTVVQGQQSTVNLWHLHAGGIRMGWARMGIHLGDARANIIEHLEGISDGAKLSGFPFENYRVPINKMINMINSGATMPEVAVVFDAWEPTFRDQLEGISCVLSEVKQAVTGAELLVVTSEENLRTKFGESGLGQIRDAITALGATILYVNSNDYRDVDQQIEARGRRDISGILIVGGHAVVPFSKIPNPTNDSDVIIYTDDIYADFNHDVETVIDLPIARIPDGDDLNLLLTQLSGTGAFSVGSFSEIAKRRPSAIHVANIINAPILVSVPTVHSDISYAQIQVRHDYFQLHGSAGNASVWWGDGIIPYPEAFKVYQANSKGIVYTGACHGAYVIDKTPANSIALTFLNNGARSFIGSTGIHYSDTGDAIPKRYGQRFAYIFFAKIASGKDPMQAFFETKTEYAAEAVDNVQRKLMHLFVYYGRP